LTWELACGAPEHLSALRVSSRRTTRLGEHAWKPGSGFTSWFLYPNYLLLLMATTPTDPPFLKGVYGKPSSIQKKSSTRNRGKETFFKCKKFVLISFECGPERLKTELFFFAVLRAVGLSFFFRSVYISESLSNTYITNYAHHLLMLGLVFGLAGVLAVANRHRGLPRPKPTGKSVWVEPWIQLGLCNISCRFALEHAFEKKKMLLAFEGPTKEFTCIKKKRLNKLRNEMAPTDTFSLLPF